MRLTLCFVIYTTAQFSCTNDLRSRKQEEVAESIVDLVQLRCHSHHIGTCMQKGQTQSSIQHS